MFREDDDKDVSTVSDVEDGETENQQDDASVESNSADIGDNDAPDSAVVDEYEEIVRKRGAKNIVEENRHRAEEMRKLREKIAELESSTKKEAPRSQEKPAGRDNLPPHIQKLITKWAEEKPEGSRVDKEFMNDLANATIDTVIDAIMYHAENEDGVIANRFKSLSRYEKKMREEILEEKVSSFEKNPALKVMVSQHKEEIKKLIRETIDPKYWEDDDVVGALIGKVYIEKLSSGQKEEQQNRNSQRQKINETENVSSAKSNELGVSNAELEEFAAQINADLTKPDVRKSLAQAIRLRKKTESRFK